MSLNIKYDHNNKDISFSSNSSRTRKNPPTTWRERTTRSKKLDWICVILDNCRSKTACININNL